MQLVIVNNEDSSSGLRFSWKSISFLPQTLTTLRTPNHCLDYLTNGIREYRMGRVDDTTQMALGQPFP